MNKVQIIHIDDVTPIEAAETYLKLLKENTPLNDGDALSFGDFSIAFAEYNTYGDKSPVYHIYRNEPLD